MNLYCKVVGQNIGRPQQLPPKYKNLSDYDLATVHGYYKFVVPTYDPVLQKLDNLYIDEQNLQVTKDVIDVEYNIDIEKTRVVDILTEYEHEIIFWKFDWYATRKIKFGTAIPEDALLEEQDFKNYMDSLRDTIYNYENVKDVLVFDPIHSITEYNSDYIKYLKLTD